MSGNAFNQPLDALCLARLRKQCRRTQEQVYRMFVDPAWNLAIRLTGCDAGAWDAVQEAFVRAFRQAGQLRDGTAFGSWLRRIVVNQAMDGHRLRDREIREMPAETSGAPPDPAWLDLERARSEMAEARTELVRAARRMAQIEREMLEGKRQAGDDERDFVLEIEEGRFEGLREPGARELVLQSIPPRLGLLLGEPESPDAGTVVGLTPGGGAETAGIEQGDRLVSVNGRNIGDNPPASIREIMSEVEAGATVPVAVQRGEERLTFDVEASSPIRDVRLFFGNMGPESGEFEHEMLVLKRKGMDGEITMPPVPPLAPLARGFSGLGHDSHLVGNHAGLEPYFGTADGVIVLRIDPDNAFNLADGDVVLRLDDEPVHRPVDLGRLLLMREAGEQVVIEIMRKGVLTQLEATIPERSETLSDRSHFEFRAAPEPPKPPVPPQPL